MALVLPSLLHLTSQNIANMRKTSLRLLLSISLFLLASFLSNNCGDGSPQPNTDATLQPAEVALKWNETLSRVGTLCTELPPMSSSSSIGLLRVSCL